MKLSARNILKGKVKSLKKGPISSLVVLEIAPGIEIVSTITAESSAALKLKGPDCLCHHQSLQRPDWRG
jgi:molybdopterin-binding protein